MKTKIKVLVTGGNEYEENKAQGMPNWFCWDTTRRFYIGNSYRRTINRLKARLIPYSVYTKEVEI